MNNTQHHYDFSQLVIATHNKSKIKEMTDLLTNLPFKLITAEKLGVEEPEETGITFEENALLKAKHCFNKTGMASLADDSGLVIPSLGGQPGIYSARWAGPERNFQLAFDRIQASLPNQNAIPAYFVSVLTLMLSDVKSITVRTECHGTLGFPPRGSHRFGYDPIFTKEGMTQTFGEIDPAHKLQISHRGLAIKKLFL